MAKASKKKTVKKSTPLPTSKSKIGKRIRDYVSHFYGPPGVGKTTFVNDLADSVLFISTDRGTRFLRALRKEVNTYSQLDRVIKQLESGDAASNYDIVALDHIDDIANMCEDYICDRLSIESLSDAGYGAGWRAYRKCMASIFMRLKRLDVGIVIISHETIKTIRTRVIETEKTMPDMGKSASKVILPMCDIVGYCGFKIVKRGDKRAEIRTITTDPRDDLYAKDRTDRVKPTVGYEALDGKSFINTFKEGVIKDGKEKSNKKGVKKVKKVSKKSSR